MEATGSAQGDSKVRIQLTTRHADLELPPGTPPILVPVKFRRYALSTLVNNLLGREKPTPFEFLINGLFLRTSLDDFLTATGISSETTLSIEFLPAIVPPTNVTSLEHDDWVKCVDVLSKTSVAGTWAGDGSYTGQDRILSGCDDGFLRIWNSSSDVLAKSQLPCNCGRIQIISCAKFMSPTIVISGGFDSTVRLWNYDEHHSSLSVYLELYGHHNFISDVAFHAPSARVLSASLDTTIGIWSSNIESLPPARDSLLPSSYGFSSSKSRNKRAKVKRNKSATQVAQRGALSILKDHTDRASAVIFSPNDATVAHSVSYDKTVRTWDLTLGTCVDTRTTSQILSCVTALPSLGLLAAGSAERHIAVLDPRASATTVTVMTLKGHKNQINGISRDPGSDYGLVSASSDGTCRVWDIRSIRPGYGIEKAVDGQGQVGESVFVIEREIKERKEKEAYIGDGRRVFGVTWDLSMGIVSCSEDGRVQINNATTRNCSRDG